MGQGTPTPDVPHPTLGTLLVRGSVVAWAVYTILGKRLAADYPAIVSTTASMGAGVLVVLPFAAAEMWVTGVPQMTIQSMGALMYLGAAASALPLLLWNCALRFVPASVATPTPI